jgi:uncharacterized protein YbjT (DUF2867 family)
VAVRVLTRRHDSDTAKGLLTLPNVTIAVGDASNEADLRAAFQGVDLAFVNTNSFAIGIRSEIYWGIRIFDIAVESGVKHYIWSSLPNALQLSGHDENYRVGHFEGKAKVAEWMKSQPQEQMNWSVLTTGPYIDMLHELLRPVKEGGEWVFKLPLENGAIPFVSLEDIGASVKWLLDHPEQSVGMNLKISVEHASGDTIARAFSAVTGQPARYESVTKEQWFEGGKLGPEGHKLGSENPDNNPNDSTLLTLEQNFGNWWNVYQKSAGNKGILQVDYEQLDKLLPDRLKSVEEWMRKENYTGERKNILQSYSGK